jgi:hypothetical protein
MLLLLLSSLPSVGAFAQSTSLAILSSLASLLSRFERKNDPVAEVSCVDSENGDAHKKSPVSQRPSDPLKPRRSIGLLLTPTPPSPYEELMFDGSKFTQQRTIAALSGVVS